MAIHIPQFDERAALPGQLQFSLLRCSLPTLPLRPHLAEAIHDQHPSEKRHREA